MTLARKSIVLALSIIGLGMIHQPLQAQAKKAQTKKAQGFDHSHKQWTKILKKHVTVDGPVSTVNYLAIQKNKAPLMKYLNALEAVTEKQYQSFTPDQKLAFLINAYNANAVRLIVDNYPIKSIRKLGGLFSPVWNKEFFKIRGKEVSLGDVEHEMIRKEFNEPRIHFGINCASIGCPALVDEAFVAKRLKDQLEKATVTFLKDAERTKFDRKKKELRVSKIFDWFDDDFRKNKGDSRRKFILSRIAPDVDPMSIEIDGYTDYDWDLNETKPNLRKLSGNQKK